MVKKSPAKILRNVIRMTKFIERKKHSPHSPVLPIFPQLAVLPISPRHIQTNPEPQSVHKQDWTVLDQQRPPQDHLLPVEDQPFGDLTMKEFAQIMENFNPWTPKLFKPP